MTLKDDFTKPVVVSPSFEILSDLDKKRLEVRIEECGRLCYRSGNKIGPETSVLFCRNVIKRGHNSVTEMGVNTYRVLFRDSDLEVSLYKTIPKFLIVDELEGIRRGPSNSWCRQFLITGSVRAFREMYIFHPECEITTAIVGDMWSKHPCLFDDLPLPKNGLSVRVEVEEVSLAEIDKLSSELHARHRHIAVRFIVNRAVTHEIVRHRPCSFLQESQRYCRYAEDKFGNRVTFIKPLFWEENEEYQLWEESILLAEKNYLELLKTSSPQASRTVLPNSCKTEIIMYANLVEWMHFMALRTSGGAEPSMREVSIPLCDELKKIFPQHGEFKKQLPSLDSYDK